VSSTKTSIIFWYFDPAHVHVYPIGIFPTQLSVDVTNHFALSEKASQTADFVPGFYTARCRLPTSGSAPHVVIANNVKQRGAPWRIHWKFTTTCSSVALT